MWISRLVEAFTQKRSHDIQSAVIVAELLVTAKRLEIITRDYYHHCVMDNIEGWAVTKNGPLSLDDKLKIWQAGKITVRR